MKLLLLLLQLHKVLFLHCLLLLLLLSMLLSISSTADSLEVLMLLLASVLLAWVLLLLHRCCLDGYATVLALQPGRARFPFRLLGCRLAIRNIRDASTFSARADDSPCLGLLRVSSAKAFGYPVICGFFGFIFNSSASPKEGSGECTAIIGYAKGAGAGWKGRAAT